MKPKDFRKFHWSELIWLDIILDQFFSHASLLFPRLKQEYEKDRKNGIQMDVAITELGKNLIGRIESKIWDSIDWKKARKDFEKKLIDIKNEK